MLLLASVALAGCGGGSDTSGAPADCTVVNPGADGTSHITVVGKNLAFDVTCIQVQPGPVRFTFRNQDSGVAHDFHVTGPGINQSTPLIPGVATQTLDLKLTTVGQYVYACDPHATMEGHLNVVKAAQG